ncbi:TPR repeat-containing protein DDB_G0287407 [Patella vulgata]|uniref:TPR repeat-containing protein DDB_G0287407 n=1 Tax=Patella vulgata TaxID=6465 RepID=UPI00217F4E52|nr:TPR repeat-containing protein DDB_G0287407 [Patella vulgata]
MGCGASMQNRSNTNGYIASEKKPMDQSQDGRTHKTAVVNSKNSKSFKNPAVTSRMSSMRQKDAQTIRKWEQSDIRKILQDKRTSNPDCNFWDAVDELISDDAPVVLPDIKRKQWKTVRLFISSTFKDMNCEREYLVKSVVPVLRQWCDERKLRLIECDLRWGVPKDADTRETLMACLSEIDRCREENEFPYFLCMLSERYGYVCDDETVPDDIKTKYNWLPGMSVTALEIFTGAYWDKNPHALFMLRSPKFVPKIQDEAILKAFVETNQESIDSLQTLKNKIKNNFPPCQVKDYDCQVKEEKDNRLTLTGLEKFGKDILEHFKKVLEKQYPNDSLGEEMTESEILLEEQRDFLLQRSGVLLGRDAAVKTVTDYITKKPKKDKLLLLAGYPGAGKSSLMAYSAKEALQNKDNKVFYHFVGATPDSTNPFSILSRVYRECMPSEDNMPQDVEEMLRFAPTMFKTATKAAQSSGFKKLVVFIDALNQMEEEGNSAELAWLPREMVPGLKIIVSTLEGKCLKALKNHNIQPEELLVEPLNNDVRQEIVEQILLEFNKQLDNEQMSLLVEKEDAGRPLWLSVACEELRVSGDFRTLTKKIETLPQDLTGLTKIVFERISKDYGEDFVVATLCVLETSRFGLMESELLELLALKPVSYKKSVKTDNNSNGKISMAEWAYVYLGLKTFLRPCGTSGEGRLDFYHRSASKVVRQVYLYDEEVQRWWHQRLADYFSRSNDVTRKAEELPFHLYELDNRKDLKKCLLQPDMFLQLYQEKTKLQLMKYWQYIGGYDIAAKSYTKFLNDYSKNVTEDKELYHLKNKLGWFLVDIGEYDAAIEILEVLLEQLENEFGNASRESADPLYAMLTLCYRRGMKFVYGNNPLTRSNRQTGIVYSRRCYDVFTKHFDKNDNKLGEVLSIAGYFNKEYLEEAEHIFKKNNNGGGLAVVYFMLGGKNQYNTDMNVPINYFEKSLALCMSSYGRLSLHPARCYQLYAQMYWNRWIKNDNEEYLEISIGHYLSENEILMEILGENHPTTVRSRQDCIIVLTKLGRMDEANKLIAMQPANNVSV